MKSSQPITASTSACPVRSRPTTVDRISWRPIAPRSRPTRRRPTNSGTAFLSPGSWTYTDDRGFVRLTLPLRHGRESATKTDHIHFQAEGINEENRSYDAVAVGCEVAGPNHPSTICRGE